MSLEQSTCTPAMQAACECVCDLYGLDSVEEDLTGTMLMAEAFPHEPADSDVGVTDAALLDEIAKAESLEGLQNKVYRLKQFLLLLRKDMETSAQLAQPKREQLKNKAQAISDRYAFMNVLKVMQGESVLQAALTAMLLILNPETLQKEQDPFAAATAFVGADSSTTFTKFTALAKGLEQAINDGRTQATQEDWATAKVRRRPPPAFRLIGLLVTALPRPRIAPHPHLLSALRPLFSPTGFRAVRRAELQEHELALQLDPLRQHVRVCDRRVRLL